MSGHWYAVVAAVAAYLLFSRPVKLASWLPLPKLVRVFLGLVLLIGSGSFVFIAVTLGVFVGGTQPSDAVGPAVVLILMAALGLAMGYIGARLIVMKEGDPLFKSARSRRHRLLVPPDGAPARREFPKAHERSPVDVPMLREILNTTQVEGELPRRWFFSHEQDLLVWFDLDGTPSAFQLAYGKYRNEHALRWKVNRGFGHYVVDDGGRVGSRSMQAPLLELDGAFPASKVRKRFLELSAEVPREIVEFIALRLQEHPEYRENT